MFTDDGRQVMAKAHLIASSYTFDIFKLSWPFDPFGSGELKAAVDSDEKNNTRAALSVKIR